MGSAFGIATLIFGKVNNGGHFNPAITLAVLMQRYQEGSSLNRKGYHKILDNLKFALLIMLSQVIGITLSLLLVKLVIYSPKEYFDQSEVSGVELMSFLCPSVNVHKLIKSYESDTAYPGDKPFDICAHGGPGKKFWELFFTEMLLAFIFISAVLHIKN